MGRRGAARCGLDGDGGDAATGRLLGARGDAATGRQHARHRVGDVGAGSGRLGDVGAAAGGTRGDGDGDGRGERQWGPRFRSSANDLSLASCQSHVDHDEFELCVWNNLLDQQYVILQPEILYSQPSAIFSLDYD
uniref:Uncharacterized protein n=1 Tax=Oryza sativa subsp. japonica TaxID=39947 RepID=Q6Z067_ORYSJ|nr:hypothetical protein [Oryza sativa Japonica Group]BAD03689.1 hypothetical protein [Oryza sativa Japonica Group]